MDSLSLALRTRTLNGNSLSPAFRTNHLYSHGSLLVIHEAFACTAGAFAGCGAWLALTSLTHGAQSFLLNCHFFLHSVHSFHEIHVHLHENIGSFGSTGLLFAEIAEKFIEICEEFFFLGFAVFIALFKKIAESAERVKTSLSASLVHLVVASKTSLVV
jgi:hypothetical protein